MDGLIQVNATWRTMEQVTSLPEMTCTSGQLSVNGLLSLRAQPAVMILGGLARLAADLVKKTTCCDLV